MRCDEIKSNFIDYIDRSLTAEEERELINHLEECAECNEELAALKKLVNEMDENREDISVPEDFMKNIRDRALKIDIPGAKKKRRHLRVLLIAAAILTMSAVTAIAAKEPIKELIKLISPEARVTNIVDRGMGDRLNISKTDKDIKVTITDVAADGIQTLISFKIEDLKSGKVYNVKYDDGIDIKERWIEQIKDTTIDMYTSLFNNEGRGTLTLYPIDTEEKTINLAFTKLETKTGGAKEVIEGNWNFEIPIKKHQSRSYDIKAVIKVQHYTIEFNKITISPTLTKLSFNCRNGSKENEEVLGLEDVRIVADGKEYKPYNFGLEWDAYSTIGFGKNEMTFDSMYFDNPKDIEIKVSRIYTKITEDRPKEFFIKLDETGPQEFEYLGSKLYINNLKVGEDITFDLKQPEYNNKYVVLYTEFWPYDEHSSKKNFSGAGNYNEVYYVDKDNNKYEYNDAILRWDEIREKRPVMYIANTSKKLHPSAGLDLKKEKFIRMIIDGYSKVEFVDETAKARLK